MVDPKTVREWLETLPEPYRTSAIEQSDRLEFCAVSLSDALFRFRDWSETKEGYGFWVGFREYIMDVACESDSIYYKGYTAAKAAFEAQQKPEPESPTFTGKIVSPVGYIAVAPDDHAELCRKADLYNDLKAVIDRLYCELEDLKKLFV